MEILEEIRRPRKEITDQQKIFIADALISWNYLIMALLQIESSLNHIRDYIEPQKQPRDSEVCDKILILIDKHPEAFDSDNAISAKNTVNLIRNLNENFRNKLVHSIPHKMDGEWVLVRINKEDNEYQKIDSETFEYIIEKIEQLHLDVICIAKTIREYQSKTVNT